MNIYYDMSETVVTNNVTNNTPNIIGNNTALSGDNSKKTENKDDSLYSYVLAGVLTIVLIMLLYYGYTRFIENANEIDDNCKELEKDDPVDDFNLREAIEELQNIQRKVLSTLSENSRY